MELKTSFWEKFTKEGRLKQLWIRALEEPDPQASLSLLREVQQRLQEYPAESLQLWITFLNVFLDTNRLRMLNETDLQAVEEMGNILAREPGLQLRPEEIWFRAVNAYDFLSAERQARALLVRIYRFPSTSADGKAYCARSLAQRGARGDDHVDIYVDFLQRTPEPGREATILQILQTICQVDFTSDSVRLKRAREVAQRLLSGRIAVRGIHTVLGLYTLLCEQAPSHAINYLGPAFEADRQDKVALTGLLAAWVQLGSYSNLAGFRAPLQTSGYLNDPVIAGLLNLGTVLQWLDSREAPGPPPMKAQSIEQLKHVQLERYVGDLVEATLGRLYLLEGNAQGAAQVLHPLVGKHPNNPQWCYYAAWANILINRATGVEQCYTSVGQWPGRWTIAALLMDADPVGAVKSGASALLEELVRTRSRSAYTPVIATRLALAQSSEPSTITWEVGKGLLEEDLEALRTVIGFGLYMRDPSLVERAIAHPLFARLPLADQTLWRGLQALFARDQARGRALLEEASVRYGHRRAALTLAVSLLEQGKVSEAKRFLDMAREGRADSKIELLRAFIDVRERHIDAAAEQLKKLASQQLPPAQYALGNLYLHQAANAWFSGQRDHVRPYREQAASTFATLQSVAGRRSLPADYEVIAHCATFIAYPVRRAEAHREIWRVLQKMDAAQQQPWIKWHAVLARVWYGSPAEVLMASSEIESVIDNANRVEDPALVALAQRLAQNCTKVVYGNQASSLVRILAHLAAQSELPTVRHYCRLGITAALRVSYQKADPQQKSTIQQDMLRSVQVDPTNGPLALLLAGLYLGQDNPKAAITIMRNIRPTDGSEQVYRVLADMLDNRMQSHRQLSRADLKLSPALMQGYTLLQIATSFAVGEPDQGYEALIQLLRQPSTAGISPAAVFRVERLLPALCAHAMKSGSIPPYLSEVLRAMSEGALDDDRLVSLARCAAAIGEVDDACRLWEKALVSNQHSASGAHGDFVKLLCHLAVVAYNAGNIQETVRRLRQAATWMSKRESV